MIYDFANILFSGPCNARCTFCIGKQLDPRLNVNNLKLFPLRNLESFNHQLRIFAVQQVVFSGTNTDPQLYQYEARLLAYLKSELPPTTRFSLHTNGRLALRKMSIFNQYDFISLSLPSFDAHTYQVMMGVPGPPDLARILAQAKVPIKISCVVNQHNRKEIGTFLKHCAANGVQRVVLRKLYGNQQPWKDLISLDRLNMIPCGSYRSNPIYDFNGVQVTLWDFCQSQSSSLNLFSSGLISNQYLLIDAQPPALAGNQVFLNELAYPNSSII